MRYVIKPDEDKTEKLSSEDTYNCLLEIVNTKNKDKISDRIYRDAYKDADEYRSLVEDQLALSYFNKCGYCEMLCKADIEHYRPKKKVEEDQDHEGYYWLCYEWTNLIPSCVKCNRDGGKHNKFPILGERVYEPSVLADGQLNLEHQKANQPPLIDEIPKLLHPEVDDPSLFFEFIIDPNGLGIRIEGVDELGRGKETISACSLNRQVLKLDRMQSVINPFKVSILALFEKFKQNKLTLDALEERIIEHIEVLQSNAKNVEFRHTLLRRKIIQNHGNFKNLVLPFFPEQIRNIMFNAFISVVKDDE